ncbi:hypothetical protein QQG55_2825 [Brugia pahangi]
MSLLLSMTIPRIDDNSHDVNDTGDVNNSDDVNDFFSTDVIVNENYTHVTFTFLSTSQNTVTPYATSLLNQLLYIGRITDAMLPWNTGRPLVVPLNRIVQPYFVSLSQQR